MGAEFHGARLALPVSDHRRPIGRICSGTTIPGALKFEQEHLLFSALIIQSHPPLNTCVYTSSALSCPSRCRCTWQTVPAANAGPRRLYSLRALDYTS